VYTHISEDNPISLFCVEIDPVKGSAEYINLGFEGAFQFDDHLLNPQPVEITRQGLGSGLDLHSNSYKFQFEQGSNFLLIVPDKTGDQTLGMIKKPSMDALLESRRQNTGRDTNTQDGQQYKTDINYSMIIISRNGKV
jgi:hypothetical protein